MVIFVSKNTEHMDISAPFFHDDEGMPAYLVTLIPENTRETRDLNRMIRNTDEELIKRPMIKLESWSPGGHLISFKISILKINRSDLDTV